MWQAAQECGGHADGVLLLRWEALARDTMSGKGETAEPGEETFQPAHARTAGSSDCAPGVTGTHVRSPPTAAGGAGSRPAAVSLLSCQLPSEHMQLQRERSVLDGHRLRSAAATNTNPWVKSSHVLFDMNN